MEVRAHAAGGLHDPPTIDDAEMIERRKIGRDRLRDAGGEPRHFAVAR